MSIMIAPPEPNIAKRVSPEEDCLDEDNLIEEKMTPIDEPDEDELSDEEATDEKEPGSENRLPDPDAPVGLLEHGTADDPVRMYLHEIGRVPLLSGVNERILAHKIEQGKRINEIRKQCNARDGRNPTSAESIVCILGELALANETVSHLQQYLGLEPCCDFKKAVFDPKLRVSFEQEIDQELTKSISEQRGQTAPEVEIALINL